MTEEKLKFVELRAKGFTFDKLAKELGKSKPTLINWESELIFEIRNLKAVELDTLYESFLISKKSKIERLANMLNSIEGELENRELTEVPTDKLFNLYLKYNKAISDEIIEPRFRSDQEIKGERMMKNLNSMTGGRN